MNSGRPVDPTERDGAAGRQDAQRARSSVVGAPLLEVRDLGKVYTVGRGTVTALRHVNLSVGDGAFIAIRGRSGAGKTTLLNLIAGLDEPTSGQVLLFGRDLAQLTEAQRTEVRRTELGFVFQSAHLFPALTAR